MFRLVIHAIIDRVKSMMCLRWIGLAAVMLLSVPGVYGEGLPVGTDFSSLNQGDAEKNYRDRKYRAYLPVEEHAKRIKMEISSYLENPTGIVFKTGDQVKITVTGGKDQELKLIVHDFANPKEKWFDITRPSLTGVQKTKVNPLPTHTEYELQEGENDLIICNPGLGYLHYRSTDPQHAPEVQVKIEGGKVNGIITRTDSPETAKQLMDKAEYMVMDLIGERIQLVFPVEGLRQGCPQNAPELISLYDRLLTYIQEDLMGMQRYHVHTGAHTLVRFLLDEPLCAGEMAAFFPKWSFPGMASVEHVTRNSWGAAHEIGHLHQTRPGLMWIGTVEVTNNIFSAYVNYRFVPERLRLEHSRSANAHGEPMHGGIFDCFVNNAITRRRLWQFQGAALPKGLPKPWEDSSRDVFTDVALMWQQVLYHMEARGQKDFFPHIFQAVRSTDESKLTQGELRVLFFKRACDAARLNLSEYFVKTGLLAPIDRMVNDYEEAHMTITREMCEEAMQYASRYPEPESSVIYYINANNMPLFREKKALTLDANFKPTIENGRMEAPTEACSGAVAFEAYRGDELLHVSLLGLGHEGLNPGSTTVICPPGTDRVYAVSWDGQREKIYGEGETAPRPEAEPLTNWLTRTNSTFSLHEAARDGNEEALRARLSGPQVKHNQYGWIIKSDEKADKAAVNAKNEQGNTPLHLAAAAGHAGIIRLLLEAGADKTLHNNADQSPADLAPEALKPLLR